MRLTILIALLAAVAAFGLWSCSQEDTPSEPIFSDGGGGDDDDDGGPTLDTNPPQPVTEMRIFYSHDDRLATVRWTAPQDDSPEEAVTRFEIRFAYTNGFYPPSFWGLAEPIADPPTPGMPGVEHAAEIDHPDRGRDLWVGIRCYDEEDNASVASDLVTVKIPGITVSGVCTDALTGLPVSGLAVRVSDVGVFNTATDGNGAFSVEDLKPGTINVRIESGAAAELYHDMAQSNAFEDDVQLELVCIPYRLPQSPALADRNMLELLKDLTLTSGGSAMLRKYPTLPVPLYAPAFVNQQGHDYQAAAHRAADEWNRVTGISLFEIVGTAPAYGITVVYRQPADIEPLTAFTRRLDDDDRNPIGDEIHIANDFVFEETLQRTMLHEVGHTIRFDHLFQPGFIMYVGQPLPNEISDDERDLVILYNALPTQIDMAIYGRQRTHTINRVKRVREGPRLRA